MVAELTESPKFNKKRPFGGAGQLQRIPFATRLKVRNLYLGLALSHKEIADRCGLSVNQCSRLISREKLPSLVRNKTSKLKANANTRADEQLEAFNAQLAEEAEEISLGALERARQSVEDKDNRDSPKNFQAWTGGISNLVKASRAVRGLDRTGQLDAGERPSVSVFVVRGVPLHEDMPRVIDVAATAAPAGAPAALTA